MILGRAALGFRRGGRAGDPPPQDGARRSKEPQVNPHSPPSLLFPDLLSSMPPSITSNLCLSRSFSVSFSLVHLFALVLPPISLRPPALERALDTYIYLLVKKTPAEVPSPPLPPFLPPSLLSSLPPILPPSLLRPLPFPSSSRLLLHAHRLTRRGAEQSGDPEWGFPSVERQPGPVSYHATHPVRHSCTRLLRAVRYCQTRVPRAVPHLRLEARY
eukprot:3533421-Rhodomonas_salina.3